MSEERTITLPKGTWEEIVDFMKHAYNEACFITSSSDFKGEGATMVAYEIADSLERALQAAEEVGRD